MTTIHVPDFEFSAFYYPQLLEALMAFKRRNVPELTDESDAEPSIQFLRAFALIGHINNTLIDLTANESTLPTARLAESVRNLLRLIAYELQPATPSQVELVYKLARVFTTPITNFIPAGAQAATRRGVGDDPTIYFETTAGVSLERTDRLGACFFQADDGEFTEIPEALSQSAFGVELDPACAIYFAHASVMWDALEVELSAPSAVTNGAWEYYKGDPYDARPEEVENLGETLRFNVNSLLGESNRAGAVVRVQLNSTTAFEDVTSQWDGTRNVVTTSLLGQSVVSTDVDDYTVGSEWKELDAEDGTALLTEDGRLVYSLPQSETENWKKTTVSDFEGYFLRFRVVETGSSTTTNFVLVRIDVGQQFVVQTSVQGRSVTAETLGSSNGAPGQRFAMAQENFILGSQEIRVDGEVWTEVRNFLNSRSQDRHYKIELGAGDRASVVFGDGRTGRIPPIGQGNIVGDYRFGAQEDGNVGARTVVIDKQGLTFVEEIYNPRAAFGWSPAQSSSTESLEKAKEEGPASLRTKEVALNADDLIDMTVAFRDSNGARPFARAFAVEEGFGPKTTELIVVTRGGGIAPPEALKELELFFNGDEFAIVRTPKRYIANQEVGASNYTPRRIDVTATVYAPRSVTRAQVANQLAALLQPEALLEDGVSYVWKPRGEVPRSRILHEIFATDSKISKVVLDSPAADIALSGRELPVPGDFTIQMVATD